MSSINPGAVNLASSFAGAQRSDASADKEKAGSGSSKTWPYDKKR